MFLKRYHGVIANGARMEAFYQIDGNRLIPTEHTRGPWSVEHQHGGPPSAMLARAVERFSPAADFPMDVARMTIELLRPVPIQPLTVEVKPLRLSKRTQMLSAVLKHGETELCMATVLRMRRESVPVGVPEPAAPFDPSTVPAIKFPFFKSDVGYHTAMELRFTRGGFGQGFAEAWMRPRFPLVAGEEISPLQRVMLCADSGNGVSTALDIGKFSFVNPDLTVSLFRPLEGEWVCLDARTLLSGHGRGLATTVLRDQRGPIGHGLQNLLIAAMPRSEA